MTESENLKLALELINKNKISDGIEILKNSKNTYNLKLLGLLFCISGEFEKAYSIFFKLEDSEEKISEYLFYLEETIKNEYIPKYNRLVKLIQENKEFKEIEKLFIELEEKFANVDLYNIATLFYLNQNNIKIAYNYYMKLNKLDSSYKKNNEFEAFFNSKKLKNKIKINYFLQIFLLGIVIFFINKNITLKEGINLKNKIKINYFLQIFLLGIVIFFINKNITLKEGINLKNKENISLEEKIQTIQSKNRELLKSKEKNSMNREKEVVIEKIIIPEEEIFTNDEIYNLILKRFKQNNYKEVLNICKKLKEEELPEYKAKEILFLKGMSYEKLSQNIAALKCYQEFLKQYNKEQYKYYIEIAKYKIIKLEKEISKNDRE